MSKINSILVAGQGVLGASLVLVAVMVCVNLTALIEMPTNVVLMAVLVLVAFQYFIHGWMLAANAYASVAEKNPINEDDINYDQLLGEEKTCLK